MLTIEARAQELAIKELEASLDATPTHIKALALTLHNPITFSILASHFFTEGVKVGLKLAMELSSPSTETHHPSDMGQQQPK